MGGNNGAIPLSVFLFLCLTPISISSSCKCRGKGNEKGPLTVVFYYHDIVYNAHNETSATSTISASPRNHKRTSFDKEGNPFGDVVVFSDPLTIGPQLNSTQIGKAYGLYTYNYNGKEKFMAWFAFTAVLESPSYNGSLSILGADPQEPRRDMPVIGGTGDFAFATGIATIQTDAVVHDNTYFRLLFTIKIF